MKSSELNVADKLISSPVFLIKHNQACTVTEHQLHFLSHQSGEKENFLQDLSVFGEKLKKRIQSSPFYWKGFGTLRYAANEMLFEPEEIRLAALQPVSAERVLRENVQHNVLVGDQEMTSRQVTEALKKVEPKRPWFVIAGWIIFIVAVIAILIFLYMKHFQTTSTGLRTIW